MDHIDAVFWLTTADHSKWLYVRPAFETIWGVPCHLLYARPALWIEQVHPEDRHRVSIATACQAHLPYDEEYRIVTPTGRIRWIRERSFPIKDHEDRVYRLAGIAQDITEAKQLESQVRASERRFRSLVELSPHAVFVNCEDKIVFANHACVKLFGATAASQLIGKPVFDFIHQESHARTQEQLSTIRVTNRTAPSIESTAPKKMPLRIHVSVRRPITCAGLSRSTRGSLAVRRTSVSAAVRTPGAMMPPMSGPTAGPSRCRQGGPRTST